MDKWKPTYDLESFKFTFSTAEALRLTVTASNDAADLGFGRPEIAALIQTMLPAHFYKSMTSYADHKVWQDVYHVPSRVRVLYVKFTADAVTIFKLLSFKGKNNGQQAVS